MYAVISELDADSAETVRSLWRKLRIACDLRAIYNLPTPHLTWMVAEGFNLPSSSSVIANLAARNGRLSTYVYGLGIFSGSRPVLYLPMVKSHALINLHNQVWDQLHSYAFRPNYYYAPDHWLPHITLAVNDLTTENLGCALEAVAFETIEMVVLIDNILIVDEETDPSSEALHRFPLIGD